METGLPPCLETKLAYLVVTGGHLFAKSSLEREVKEDDFRNLFLEAEGWVLTALQDWRCPQLGLDLLQLAALCDNPWALCKLVKLNFLAQARYTEGAVCVDYPLHLACSLGHSSVVDAFHRVPGHAGFWDVSFKEGQVTLAVRPATCSPAAPAVRLDSPLRGTAVDLALQGNHTSCLEGLLLAFSHVLNNDIPITAAWIEVMWRVLSYFYEKEQSLTLLYGIFCWRRQSEILDSFFLMKSQLLLAADIRMTEKCSLSCLPLMDIIGDVELLDRLDILETVAEWCSLEHVQAVVRYMRDDTRPLFRSHFCRLHPRRLLPQSVFRRRAAILEVFERHARERTLEQNCVLSILSRVRNPRSALGMSVLPGGLHKRFLVPFQGLYKRLTDTSE